jgi:hypothetical protein
MSGLTDIIKDQFNLKQRDVPRVISSERVPSHDKIVLNSLECPDLSLSLAVDDRNETGYTNLINATLVELVKKFDSLIYDPEAMILQHDEKMLLIAVMDNYVFFPRSFEHLEYFRYISVVIHPTKNMADDYVGLGDVMKRVFAWIDSVV